MLACLLASLLAADASAIGGRQGPRREPGPLLGSAILGGGAPSGLDAPAAPPSWPPLPADWREAKRQWQLGYDAVLAAYPGPDTENAKKIREIFLELDRLGKSVAARTIADAERAVALIERQPIDAAGIAELQAKARYVAATRLLYLYGFILPQSVNEGFGEHAYLIPGYPFQRSFTPMRFCDDFARYGTELDSLLGGIDPNFFPPPARSSDREPESKPLCERSGWPEEYFRLGR